MAMKLWLPLILVLSLSIMETDGGLLRLLGRWKERCKSAFQNCKLIYKLMKFKNQVKKCKPGSNNCGYTTGDYDLYARRVKQFLNTDTETLKKRYENMRKQGDFKSLVVDGMFDYCAKEAGNTTNLIEQIKSSIREMDGIDV